MRRGKQPPVRITACIAPSVFHALARGCEGGSRLNERDGRCLILVGAGPSCDRDLSPAQPRPDALSAPLCTVACAQAARAPATRRVWVRVRVWA